MNSDVLSRRTRITRAAAVTLGTAAVAAVLVMLVVLSSQTATSSQRILEGAKQAKVQRHNQTVLSEQIKALALRLTECTTRPDLRRPPAKIAELPQNDCYVQQQKGAADFGGANGPLSPLLTAAAACGAAHPGDIKATRRCVMEGLR